MARDGRDRVCLCAVRSIGRQSPPPPRSQRRDPLAGSPECCCCLQTQSHSDTSWSLQPRAESLLAERIPFRRIVALLWFLQSFMSTIELVGLHCIGNARAGYLAVGHTRRKNPAKAGFQGLPSTISQSTVTFRCKCDLFNDCELCRVSPIDERRFPISAGIAHKNKCRRMAA